MNVIPSAIIRAWKTDFCSPHPSLPYPIIPFNADSASEECLATTIGPHPDDSRFLFLDNSRWCRRRLTGQTIATLKDQPGSCR
jgi:hypothetical protein